MPTSAEILLDTSAAIPLILAGDPAHGAIRAATEGLTRGLAGHALFETYSVLTRLPGDHRLSAEAAHRAIGRAFPASVGVAPDAALRAVATLAASGIAGGAVYDGLVGLAARQADLPLLSRDRRAAATYAVLGVDVRFV